ncbi:transglycosylase family protein [Rhodococcus erythropolis]|uniref:transglycosylase family protein n=1 Tax=Rhodococcus erythropolis TaxID=1833 RepID=UPI003981F99A
MAATTTKNDRLHRMRRWVYAPMMAAVAAGAVCAGAGIGSAQSAHAPADHNWDAVARCESTENWNLNTGNGFYGGLQITQRNWDWGVDQIRFSAGHYFADRPDLDSPANQKEVAEALLKVVEIGVWPVCGRYL